MKMSIYNTVCQQKHLPRTDEKKRKYRYTEEINSRIDKAEVQMCLSCTSEKCNGECNKIKEFRKSKGLATV